MKREIVLDTETTGFDPTQGDRMVEIGCIELINHMPTGKHLQLYINPERNIPEEVIAVHGITNEFVADKPTFEECYTDFIDFIGKDSKLVIHNAEFDMKFLNYQLGKVGHPAISWSRVIDTLAIARKKFPGSPANLDALCRRYEIDNTERTYHGALLDSELLAEVYLELIGGRQHGLSLSSDQKKSEKQSLNAQTSEKKFREPRNFKVSDIEKAAHEELLQKLNEPLWKKRSA
ncbi:MAG: DNA polymerase III subunit epsilon [Bdellovibrionales bacterium]